MSISTKYNPAEIEGKWYQFWEENGFFKSVPDDREPYTIVIPPPNVTGILHMGHILNNTIQDILIRRKRMEGFNACWVPGTDHASIATEAKVVKQLRDQGIKKSDLTREEFLKHAFAWKDKYGGIILQQLRKLGCSCDWDRTRFTMDDDYYESVIRVFCDLYDKGLIYRGIRMVNWDPAGKTALSDEEVIHREAVGKLHQVRYLIEGTTDQYVTIATTRPETILGDTAISVHPNDKRYQHLVGKKALVPLINRPIPIIADDYVTMEFGTGCLKVTPAHDVNDYQIGQRHNLPIIDVLNADGTMSEAAQLYIGTDRFECRKLIVKDLEAAGHIVKIEDYPHSVGHSERTDAVIEPRLSLQWWVSMKTLGEPAYKAVMEDTINLIPSKFKNTYRHWMENIKDWCISRQLWWGQQIPCWYLESEKELDETERQLFVAPTPEEALEKARKATGNASLGLSDMYQDADVLDTWFSSWLWPFQVFKGITNPGNEELKYYYPTNDLVTGPDILFFWVARMIIAGYEYMGEKPFTNVYLTGLIRDQKGRKMSKSLGNSPDALDLIALYGADGVRVGILLSSPAGGDLMFDTPLDVEKDGLSSKLCETGRNFANKIWNARNLVSMWTPEGDTMSNLEERSIAWMQARVQQANAELTQLFEQFRLSEALMLLYKLIWDDFCSWFLEMLKPRGTSLSVPAYEKALDLFEQLLQMVHPFMPFISEEIWQNLRERKSGEALILARNSIVLNDNAGNETIAQMGLIHETISAIRSLRLEKGISNKTPIELFVNTTEPEIFRANQEILSKFLNLESLDFSSEPISGAATVRVKTHEFYIPLGDSIDVEAEKAKIREEIKYLEGFLVSVMRKLDNEKFVANAAPAVVENERQKKADSETKLKMLQENLASLG
ncbi:MAG: valine--tRNA ligase [Bacteroidia bacterium]|nr:valine--tRNA ligase [Bacteroidia bacterium]